MLDTPHTSSQARAEKDDKIIGGIDNLGTCTCEIYIDRYT